MPSSHKSVVPIVKIRGPTSVFWLDSTALSAVQALIDQDAYAGVITDVREGRFQVQESIADTMVLSCYIADQPSYTEKDCRSHVKQLAQMVQLLHRQNVAHRSLLPDNVVVDNSGRVKLKGLRYARSYQPGVPIVASSGYRFNWYGFKAPESEGYEEQTESVDVWSLGSLLYMLLTGLPPFRGTHKQLVFHKQMEQIEYDTVLPSELARRLVQRMLRAEPGARPSIGDTLDDPWMQESDENLQVYDLGLAKEIFKDWANLGEGESPIHHPSDAFVRFEV